MHRRHSILDEVELSTGLLRVTRLALLPVLATCVLLFAAAPVRADTIVQASDGSCVVTSTLPQPPMGSALEQTAQIDPANCSATFGTVQQIPAASLPAEPASTASDPTFGGPLDVGSPSSATSAGADAASAGTCHTWNTHSTVYDNNVANIQINGLTTSTNYCYAGGLLTGVNGSYHYHVHKEMILGVCNPLGCGWTAHHTYYSGYAGCANGCTYFKAHAHADFTYAGDFDPFGAIFGYHNYLDQYNEFDGSGSVSCTQTFRAKVNPGNIGPVDFFYWHHGCSLS